jgi:hypothetical protein
VSRNQKPCKAKSSAVLDSKGKRGQDITLTCDRSGRHMVHEDKVVKAKFVKVGKGGPVWPSR